jgi:NADP-dependent 3-hydroxy acid dehydrogenase YdfG
MSKRELFFEAGSGSGASSGSGPGSGSGSGNRSGWGAESESNPTAAGAVSRWEGRVALVTGASSGIGRAVAEELAAAGLQVVVAARREERLQALEERWPDRVDPRPVDLRDVSAVGELFAGVRERWGGVDVLVNNAGLGHHASLLDGDAERWREMLEVNVLALCVCTREAVADMRRRQVAGHVIHLSSMSGHRVPAGGGVYAATKHAVDALTEGLRQELRAADSPIRVSAISPGLVETGFAEHLYGSADKARELYGRFPCLQPEDIARAVRYVLEQPDHVQVHDILVRPTRQPS